MINAATKTVGGCNIGPDSIFGMTSEQIKKTGIQVNSFFAVVSPQTACRLKAGGTMVDASSGKTFTWPTAPDRAHLGAGFYSWDNINAAKTYCKILDSIGRTGPKKIVEVQFSQCGLNNMRQLNVDNLGNFADRWLDQHSLLSSNNPCRWESSDYDHITRGTAVEVNGVPQKENYFTPTAFKKGTVVDMIDCE